MRYILHDIDSDETIHRDNLDGIPAVGAEISVHKTGSDDVVRYVVVDNGDGVPHHLDVYESYTRLNLWVRKRK